MSMPSQMRLCLLVLLLMLQSRSMPAQSQPLSFLHYTTEQGLSHDNITSICKDALGFMWIGTVNGLNRYDGHSFRIFHHLPGDPNSLTDDAIMGLTPGPDGRLWIATNAGVCYLDPVNLRITRIILPENKDTLINDVTTRVAFDSKGRAWTSAESGLYAIDPVSEKVIRFIPTSAKTVGWFGMKIDAHDRLWTMKDSLRRFDPETGSVKRFIGVDPKESLVNAGVLSLCEDASGQWWAGTWNGGIWKYMERADDFQRFSRVNLAMHLLPDSIDGQFRFWVGGGSTGLCIYDPAVNAFTECQSVPEDPFTHNNYLASCMYRDPDNGDVWFGTEVGLEHYAPSTLRFQRAMIPRDENMSLFSLVSGVVEDRTDPAGQRHFISLWGSGLFEWNKSAGTFTRSTIGSMLAGRNTFHLFQDTDGYIWGCLKDGIARYHPVTNKWHDYTRFFQHPEKNNVIWFGLQDHQGRVWFAANKEGLLQYNPKTDQIDHVLFRQELLDASGYLNLRGIAEDSLGRLWLISAGGYLVRYDPETKEARRIVFPNTFRPGAGTSVLCGRDGRIYAAFYADLLILDLEGNILEQYNQQSGLKSNRIMFLVQDPLGKVWINSEYLLHCFDPRTRTFTYYGKPDGLFGNAMTDALSITPSGTIYIGFQNAFNFFDPLNLRFNRQPPPVAITSIRVMNKERSVSALAGNHFWSRFFQRDRKALRDTVLVLQPGEDFFEVEFAALNFNQQERNQYAYQLVGFNRDWVYTLHPVATFTNLDGGEYTLRMKASNNDGVWNEKGTNLRILVKPPFQKTQWFPIVIGMVLAMMAFGWLWLRRQQRRRIERFRETIARDLHDEMGSTLSSIRFFSDFAHQQVEQAKPEVVPVLQRISQSATNLSESLQDIIWAMKLDQDHLEDLTAHMTEFGYRLFEAKNILFKTHIREDIPGKQLRPEMRRNLYLIFKEAVNNAAKYARADLVELHFLLKKGSILMKIVDNGEGFSTEEMEGETQGHGLKNMRRRAEEIGGQLKITSAPGAGTTVELKVSV